MSRIFDGANDKDIEDLMAIIRINPDIQLQYKYQKLDWNDRAGNYNPFEDKEQLRGFDQVALYRIKEDQS